MLRLFTALWLYVGIGTAYATAEGAGDPHLAFIDGQIAAHTGQSGVYVLDRGEQSLLARAWLADHAKRSIDVQYFIWSTDNIGILASEALLRAAERGVHVRVIVDDLLIAAPDRTLLALALHPNIDIRIYNPQHSVGTYTHKRVINLLTNFRGFNQRMHNKTFIVDGKIAITGGRNMADEYYDYDHAYNFRDRDALVLGPAAADMRTSFEQFWQHQLSVDVEALYDGLGLMQRRVNVSDAEVQRVYGELHAYAQAPANFAPEVRAAIAAMPTAFPRIARDVVWTQVEYISDVPGKNDRRFGLGGGGLATDALAGLVAQATRDVLIQSPYVVLSDAAIDLFAAAIARGVRVRISTNSLASTDNIPAFAGYRNQRKRLLKMGLEIFEYRPDPALQTELARRIVATREHAPVFALHAKTLVVDGKIAYIGTYNLDPRSENLNTEAGVIVRNPAFARAVAALVVDDMRSNNSWSAATDNPDQFVSCGKRSRVRFWQFMPIKPLL